MLKTKLIKKYSGVTLTELLVVLAIIALLATIAVPVYINRAEQSKIRVARQECQELARAEEICAAYHGYYVPLQVLDDLPITTNIGADSLDKEPGSLYLIDAAIPANVQQLSQRQLQDFNTNPKVASLYYNWQGPFLNPTRVYYNTALYDNPWDPGMSSTDRRRDFPLDPWGQPYRMYSELGIIGSGATTTNYNSDNFSDGLLTSSDPNRFDRYAIVSFGPDGLRDTDPGRSATAPLDDIVYYFGAVITETAYRFW